MKLKVNLVLMILMMITLLVSCNGIEKVVEDTETVEESVDFIENEIVEETIDKENEENNGNMDNNADQILEINEIDYMLYLDGYEEDSSKKIDLNELVIGKEHINYFILNYIKSELSLLRNAYFAKHGYVFNNQNFNEFYSTFSWYIPDNTIEDINSRLSDSDWQNVNVVLGLEEFYCDDTIDVVFDEYGFKITLPKAWEDKYRIFYFEHSISFRFSPKIENEDDCYEWGLFSLWEESYYDEIWGVENTEPIVTSNGVNYYLFTPTGVEFPNSHPELLTF